MSDTFRAIAVDVWNHIDSIMAEADQVAQQEQSDEAGDEYGIAALDELITSHLVCGMCDGSGSVDSGAPDPQGRFIEMPCPECNPVIPFDTND